MDHIWAFLDDMVCDQQNTMKRKWKSSENDKTHKKPLSLQYTNVKDTIVVPKEQSEKVLSDNKEKVVHCHSWHQIKNK